MLTAHVISLLEEENPLVQAELDSPPMGKEFHKLQLSKEELKFPEGIASSLRDQLMKMPLKVGEKVTIVCNDNQILEENTCVSILLRRFLGSVSVSVRRPSRKQFIPHLAELRPYKKGEDRGMVSYNYRMAPPPCNDCDSSGGGGDPNDGDCGGGCSG